MGCLFFLGGGFGASANCDAFGFTSSSSSSSPSPSPSSCDKGKGAGLGAGRSETITTTLHYSIINTILPEYHYNGTPKIHSQRPPLAQETYKVTFSFTYKLHSQNMDYFFFYISWTIKQIKEWLTHVTQLLLVNKFQYKLQCKRKRDKMV